MTAVDISAALTAAEGSALGMLAFALPIAAAVAIAWVALTMLKRSIREIGGSGPIGGGGSWDGGSSWDGGESFDRGERMADDFDSFDRGDRMADDF